jgi:hypothetical protein
MGLGLLFPVLLLAMGAYVLVGAIKGKGRLFSLENFKDDCKEKGRKILRAIYFALAGIMLFMALVNFAQSSLFGSSTTYYRLSDAYREAFIGKEIDQEVVDQNNNKSHIIMDKDGRLTYTTTVSTSSGMSCMGATSTGKDVTYGPYDASDQAMEMEEISAYINSMYTLYPEAFPTASNSGLMSCMGGSSADPTKFYEQTNLIKVVDGKDVPVYGTTDAEKAEGHVVYTSSYGKVRSDANDGSFASKLYSFLTPTLLKVLNYVFLGLAVVGLVLLFVLTSRFTDKEKLRKARAQQSGASASMPSGAFNFDEDEK